MTWNKQMLTVEDANSILNHFGEGLIDYYILDTRKIEYISTNYDFVNISVIEGSVNTISFKIENSLWTGGFNILKTNLDSWSTSVDENNVINVSGNNLRWVVLELELSTDFKHNKVFKYDFTIRYDKLIKPISDFAPIPVYFVRRSLNENDEIEETPVENLSINDGEYVTDSNGCIHATSYSNPVGTQKINLRCRNTNVDVEYNILYKYIGIELPISARDEFLNRGCTNKIFFDLIIPPSFNSSTILENIGIKVIYGGKTYDCIIESIDEHNYFYVTIPVADVDTVDLTVQVLGNEYINDYILDFEYDTNYVHADNDNDLINVLKSDYIPYKVICGMDSFNNVVNLDTDIELIFNKVISSDLDSIFNISNNAKVIIKNMVSENCNNIFKLNECMLNLVNCQFNHSKKTIIKGDGILNLDNCSFVDNNSCINVNGDITIYRSLFDLSDINYSDSKTVPFVSAYGNLKVNESNFELNLVGLDELGYSYVMFKLSDEFKTNNIDNNQLLHNNTFDFHNNNSKIYVKSNNYEITGKNNKAVTWTIQNTNTVFYNNITVNRGLNNV